MTTQDSFDSRASSLPDERIRTFFDSHQANSALSTSQLELLRSVESELKNCSLADVAPESWAMLMALYNSSGQLNDIMRLGHFAASNGISAAGWIGIYLRHYYLQHGPTRTRRYIYALTQEQQSLPAVELRLAYCHYDDKNYSAVVSYCQSVQDDEGCPNDVGGLFLCSLLESGNLSGLSQYLAEASGQNRFIPPWAAMKAITQLHAGGGNEVLIAAITDRFLSTRTGDRIDWEVNILVQTGQSDEAENLILQKLLDHPEDEKLCITLATFALESMQWLKYEHHLRSTLKNGNLPGELSTKLFSAVRCLDYLYEESNRTPPAILAKDLKFPDSLYEAIITSGEISQYTPKPGSVALVGATMAAGGAERVLAHAFKGLIASGKYNVKLWLFRIDEDMGYDFYLKEMNISQADVSLLSDVSSIPEPFCWLPYEHARRTYNLYLKIREEKPEVVHGWQDGINIDVIVAATLAGVKKIVLHTHNMRPDKVHKMRITGSLKRIYAAAVRKENTHLVCVSDASLRDYLSWLGVERNERHHVVYNGFSLDVIDSDLKRALRHRYKQQYGLSTEKYVVGSAFRFDEIKRPDLWLEVARELIDSIPDVHFVIFGDGPLREGIQRRLHKLNISQYFTLPGIVSDVPYKLSMFDLFLLTSRSEGLPTVVIEAQFVGVPIVAPNVGGIGECILRGESGELVTQDSTKEFANTILAVRNKCGPSIGPSSLLQGFLQERFSHARMVLSLEKLYETENLTNRSLGKN